MLPALVDRIIAEALTWQDVPYAHMQSTKWGCDCIGLCIGIARAVGCIPVDYQPEPYSLDFQLHNTTERLREGIEALGGMPAPLGEAAPGMMVLFRFGHVASHAGILLPGPQILHAKRQTGRVVRHGFHPARHGNLVAAYSFPEASYANG